MSVPDVLGWEGGWEDALTALALARQNREVPGMESEPMEFVTSYGCTIAIRPAPASVGDGVFLSLSIDMESDSRYAEVYLDRSNIHELRTFLMRA